jgi:hypothetical protein
MNKLMKTLTVGLLCLLWAAAATATEGPPVKIRLMGEPRGVEEGETFKGTLEILMGASANLTGFRFEGNGWRTLELDVSDDLTLDKDSRLEIPFEVQALSGAGVQEFKFEFEGRTVSKSLNLTRAHFDRMTQAEPTREVPEGAEPIRNPEMQPVDMFEDEGAAKGAQPDDPEDQEVVANRTINVNGRFVYQRSDGVTIGADGVAVRIYDSDTLFDDHLATTVTDAYGYYSVNINTDDAGENNPDLYVNFEAANSQVEVEDATWENNYSWETGTWDNFSGGTLNVGWRSPSDEGEHPALHILTNITRTWRWLLNHEGYDTPDTDVQWPDGATGAYYVRFWEEIHVGVDRQWREDTHSHEYMHHWVNNYSNPVDPDYCNGMCDGDSCGHCIWCWETDHDAFNEGFPNWIADVLTRSYAGDYGIASQFFRNQENINTCGQDGTWDDPYTTEGFLGALLRDIEDTANDDHAHYPGFADAMGIGTNEIFDVVDFDEPTTPAAFLEEFKTRYPNLRESLWETAKNCGYDFDAAAPGAVSSLTSSSHSIGGDSPDPTVRYTWTRAYDDASGIAGYGLFISSAPGMPSPTMDIGDVTSYTTPTLAPGSYHFNIRAVDRDGNWSSSYRSFGPITIRAPEPSDITSYQPTGWQYPLVPRSDNTATPTNATVSSSLPGNSVGGTYWNVRGINQGESATSSGFVTRLFVDDVSTYWASWAALGAGVSFYGTNLGPFTVRGGRHALEARYDANDQVAEEDEDNNRYGRQFIWTPYQLASNTPITRVAPPAGDAGWDAISGAALWFNCDGLRTGNPGWWNAVLMYATDNTDNYDARLHAVSTGPENGFTSNLGYSARPAGYLDAVMTNRNVVSETAWDVGVLNNTDSGSSYRAVHETSTTFAFGDSLTLSMAQDDYLDLREFFVGTDFTGFVSVTVDVEPGSAPLKVGWLPSTFDTGSLTSYDAVAVTDYTTGRARLDLEIPETGYNCLVIFREPADGGDALDYTLEIQTTPPDFRPLYATGWHAPIVPRPADDGTGSSVALPDTLYGNVASTYLNFAVRNDSPSPSPEGFPVRAYIDGVYRAWFSWGAFAANTNGLFNWELAWNIPGGRHTLDLRCDPLMDIEEIYETNNTYGEQYVWSPLDMATNSVVSRNAPPDRTGGWDEIASGESLWFNCDGLRIPGYTTWWQAMAVMPGTSSDVDVRLHPVLEGTKDGFGTNVALSSWGFEQSDFVMINYNTVPFAGMDVGVLNSTGTAGYTAEHVGSTFLGNNPTDPTVPANVENGRIMDLVEVFLDPDDLPGGYFSVRLEDLGGNVDWGLSMYQANVDFHSKASVVPGAASWGAGPGENEAFEALITESGYYCLAVWKAKSDDLAKNGSYRLVFGNALTPVGDELPRVTALSGVYPNPFNPQTTIAFDLAHPTRTELAIYDLQGSLVRTLVSETRQSGRHEVVWQGKDNQGQQVASGVYMARLKAGNLSQMRKLVLIK